jgi:hypothetical protein
VIPPATVNMNTDPKLLIVTEETENEVLHRRPSWTHDGTFLVFRKLEQDVKGFKTLKSGFKDYDCENEAHMGAKLMGRWPGGEFQHFTSPSPLEDGDADRNAQQGRRLR